MKRLLCLFVPVLLIACEKNESSTADFNSETITMATESANDVYYQLSTGSVKSANRNDWDIEFSVPLQTATIRINEGAGVELYCVGDTGDWEGVSENTIEGLDPRFNSKSEWYEGAFNVNATGFPNYGWGTYHAGNPDHNVGGDSLYILKLSNGAYVKFMIRAKLGANSGHILRWADTDGTHENIDTLSTAPWFQKQHFVQYSLVNGTVVDAEPEIPQWDLLFTRYVIQIPAGPGVIMNYPVTGVLINPEVTAAKIEDTEPESVNLSTAYTLSGQADVIGYDWKNSDPITHEITLTANTSYIVKANDGKIYQLYFNDYGGLTDGTITFKLRLLE